MKICGLMKIYVLTVLVFTHFQVVTAFSGGAGRCLTNGVSVAGSHLSNVPLTTPSFEEQGYALVLNVGNMKSETILSSNRRFGLTVGGSYTISLIANGTASFRGALIRFSDDVGTMEAGLNARLAQDTCGPFPAVTHMDNTDKTILTGMMTFDVVGNVTVLCDVVEFNNANDGSSYSFQQYQIAVMEEKPETMAPPMGSPPMTQMPATMMVNTTGTTTTSSPTATAIDTTTSMAPSASNVTTTTSTTPPSAAPVSSAPSAVVIMMPPPESAAPSTTPISVAPVKAAAPLTDSTAPSGVPVIIRSKAPVVEAMAVPTPPSSGATTTTTAFVGKAGIAALTMMMVAW